MNRSTCRRLPAIQTGRAVATPHKRQQLHLEFWYQQCQRPTGEAGGTFARNTAESFYGDTSLADLNGAGADKLDLSNTISASGLFDVLNVTTSPAYDGEMFIGHYSTPTTSGRRELIGIEIVEQDASSVRARARMYIPTGDYTNGISVTATHHAMILAQSTEITILNTLTIQPSNQMARATRRPNYVPCVQ